MTRFAVLALGLGTALSGCQTEATPELQILPGSGDRPSLAIYNGSAPDQAEHEAVVALHQLQRRGKKVSVYVQPFCSGTLIRDNVVVTAAHCLEGMSASKVAVFVGDEASQDSTASNYIWSHLYDASSITSHSSYSSSQLTDDIGLIVLDSDAATAEGVTPVPELPASEGFTSSDVTAGLNLNFAGFGVTETGSSGTKLQVDLALGGLGCSVTGCPSSGDNATQVSYSQPSSDGGPCSGDSGGPAFITRTSGTYVAGLTSYGDSGCVIYGVSTRVDAYESWIASTLGETDTGGPVDTGDSGDPGTDTCGDGTCDDGESCDGRDGTTSCSADCDGVTKGKPANRYCYVGSTCEGAGCP